jgi:translation initiation factor 2 subunit 2
MADKPRKSVAFADEGDESGAAEVVNGEKETIGADDAAKGDKEVDEVTAMFEGLAKKKKKKSVKKEGDEDDEAVADDGEVDLSALKKKKKKKPKTTEDDFEKQLAEAGVADDKEGEDTKEDEVVTGVQDGDVHGGTGIWAHDETKNYNYESLLSRFFLLLHDSHPDLASSGGKSYKIPPPQCLREGNKKTIFANIADICKRMKRTDEHVTSFLFAELGTSGSVDGSRRLVIKGRFQQKQIENVLRRYIGKFFVAGVAPSMRTIPLLAEQKLTRFPFQSNTSHAKLAVLPTLSSTRERTVSTSSPAIHVDRVAQSLRSRLVSLHKLASVREFRAKWSLQIGKLNLCAATSLTWEIWCPDLFRRRERVGAPDVYWHDDASCSTNRNVKLLYYLYGACSCVCRV